MGRGRRWSSRSSQDTITCAKGGRGTRRPEVEECPIATRAKRWREPSTTTRPGRSQSTSRLWPRRRFSASPRRRSSSRSRAPSALDSAAAARKKQGRCGAPRDVCITLNAEAEEAIARGTARAVGLAEALDALRRSHEAGLVHLAYRHGDGDGDVGVFCSCCTCCCWFLSALREFDYHDAIAESAFVVRFDEERCAGCGACVERCPFAAWAADAASSDGVSFSPDRCFGCGLCVGTCPTGALALVPRDGAGG